MRLKTIDAMARYYEELAKAYSKRLNMIKNIKGIDSKKEKIRWLCEDWSVLKPKGYILNHLSIEKQRELLSLVK